jgi:hypothetical protein
MWKTPVNARNSVQLHILHGAASLQFFSRVISQGFYPHSSFNLPLLQFRLLGPLLNVVALVRSSRSAHLVLRHWAFDLLHVHQLLDAHDLTRDGLADWVVYGRHSLLQAEGVQYTLNFLGHTDAGAHEGYAEVGHCAVVWEVDAVGGRCCAEACAADKASDGAGYLRKGSIGHDRSFCVYTYV